MHHAVRGAQAAGFSKENEMSLVETACENFRRFLAKQGSSQEWIELCLKYPPWIVYEFGENPRRGRIVGVGQTEDGNFTVRIAILDRYNQNPPLMFERKVFGIPIETLREVDVDHDVLRSWAEGANAEPATD